MPLICKEKWRKYLLNGKVFPYVSRLKTRVILAKSRARLGSKQEVMRKHFEDKFGLGTENGTVCCHIHIVADKSSAIFWTLERFMSKLCFTCSSSHALYEQLAHGTIKVLLSLVETLSSPNNYPICE